MSLNIPDQKFEWEKLTPVNTGYVKEHSLDRKIQFMRTISIPYYRLIVISGEFNPAESSKMCF